MSPNWKKVEFMGDSIMKDDEKAEIILDALDEYMTINWNLKDFYLKAIKKGLKEIEDRENTEL